MYQILCPFPLLRLLQRKSSDTKQTYPFSKKTTFYGEMLLATRPYPRLEDQLLLAVRDYLFYTFAVSLHFGGRSSTRNVRTRHTAVTCHGLAWLFLYSSFFSIHTLSFIFLELIHSFSILSDHMSKASSKTMSPNSAIQSLLLQMRISFPVLKVIQ